MTTEPYSTLDDTLHRLALGIGAAELHGSLTGIALNGASPPRAGWMQDLQIEGLDEALADDGVRDSFDRLYAHLFEALESPDLSFAPLLPTDDAIIDDRARALVDWCRGFLSGLGLAGVRPREQLSDDANEVLTDLARIAATRFDAAEDGDDGENAYAEVVEYVRIGVMLLHNELTRLSRQATRH